LSLKRNTLKTIFLVASVLGFIVSCATTQPPDKDDVFVRIEKRTGMHLKTVTLGQTIIKRNSYSHTNYWTQFKKIGDGETTGYKNIRGKHLGLKWIQVAAGRRGADMRVKLPGDVRMVWKYIREIGGVASSVAHPYSGKALNGYTLADGKYTFELYLDTERSINLRISSDSQ